MDEDATDRQISAALDSGFLPPDPEALEAAIRALYAVTGIVRLPAREDSVDGLLVQVGMDFHALIADLLAEEVVGPVRSTAGVIFAGVLVQSVAALLTLLNLRSLSGAPDRTQGDDGSYAQGLQERWLKTIVDVSRSEHEPPWHVTPAAFVTMASSALSEVARTLRDKPQMLLDPQDPCLQIRPEIGPARDRTPDDAGRQLVWFAAAALCIVACCHPGFRLGAAA